MASNVPLRRVREAVVAGIVDLIPIVSDSPARQRAEIAKVMDRWGELINLIGGVDAVETVSVLQVSIITSRIPDIRSPSLLVFCLGILRETHYLHFFDS